MISARQHEREKDDAKTSNDFARVAAQSAILINGGAATAVLSFLSGGHTPAQASNPLLHAFGIPLTIYAMGVFMGVMSLLVASWAIERFMLYWGSGQADMRVSKLGSRAWNVVLTLIALSALSFIASSIILAAKLTS